LLPVTNLIKLTCKTVKAIKTINKAQHIRHQYIGRSKATNQIQQTHTGPLYSVTNSRLLYVTDTTGGNSGSPIIEESTGRAVGVHTHGGCYSTGGANSGTRATVSEFWNALNNPAAKPIVDALTENVDQTH
jgi:trimeric autotransporter adhesin